MESFSFERTNEFSNFNFFNKNLETFSFDIFLFKHFKTGNLLLYNFTYLLSLLIVTCPVSIAAKFILTVTVIKCVTVVSARRKFLIGFNDGWEIWKCVGIVVVIITVKVSALFVKGDEKESSSLIISLSANYFGSCSVTWQSKHLQFSVNSQVIPNIWAASR